MTKKVKLDNKGFALVETLIVSVAVMIIFSILFANFYPLSAEYVKADNYDTTDSKYVGYWMRRLFLETTNISILDNLSNSECGQSCKKIESCDALPDLSRRYYCDQLWKLYGLETIYITTSNIESFKTFAEDNMDDNRALQEYIKYLPNFNSVPGECSEFRLIFEYGKEDNNGKSQFGTIGVKKEISAKDRPTVNFDYTGGVQTFTVPIAGYYNIELWGAQGGTMNAFTGGNGGYTSGSIYLTKDEQLYVYVGGTPTSNEVGGYNGGGSLTAGQGIYGRAGGGATDIRLSSNGTWNDATSLRSRIMVAGGGGGANSRNFVGGGAAPYGDGNGGPGGTLAGGTGLSVNNSPNGWGYGYGTGGSQITGGSYTTFAGTVGTAGSTVTGQFGMAQPAPGTPVNVQSAGGSGYYGGGSAQHGGGGGGSSFMSGYAGSNAVTSSASTTATNTTKHYLGKYVINGNMRQGIESMPNPSGGTMTGKTGNGYAKITYLGMNKPARAHKKLDNVRFIKSCINGNIHNTGNHWVQVQAVKDGVNLAKGKTVTGTVSENNSTTQSYTNIVDGMIDNTTGSSGFGASTTSSPGYQCITVDLGTTYDLDEVVLWLYWFDGRRYKDNVFSIGNTNVAGTGNLSTVLHNFPGTTAYNETANGRRYSAYKPIS